MYFFFLLCWRKLENNSENIPIWWRGLAKGETYTTNSSKNKMLVAKFVMFIMFCFHKVIRRTTCEKSDNMQLNNKLLTSRLHPWPNTMRNNLGLQHKNTFRSIAKIFSLHCLCMVVWSKHQTWITIENVLTGTCQQNLSRPSVLPEVRFD